MSVPNTVFIVGMSNIAQYLGFGKKVAEYLRDEHQMPVFRINGNSAWLAHPQLLSRWAENFASNILAQKDIDT